MATWRSSRTRVRSGVKDCVANNGHLEVLTYLYEQSELLTRDTDAMDLIAMDGHIDVVRFLQSHDRTEGCTRNAMDKIVCWRRYSDNIEWLYR